MYLDTMQQIFSSTSKVMVDAKTGSNLLYLPLDKLIAQAAATDAQPPPRVPRKRRRQPAPRCRGADAVGGSEPPRDPRSRESLRDRESR
jgi:membrane protease subunit HflK